MSNPPQPPNNTTTTSEEDFKWIEQPCLCGGCTQLRNSFIDATAVSNNANPHAPSYPSVLKAAVAVKEALQVLHREHRPELYVKALVTVTGLMIEEGPRTPGKQGVEKLSPDKLSPSKSNSPEKSFREKEKRKFLVCDHCMSHGLTCNEASVCEQCRNYNVPCIHRWCAISPTSQEDCTNPRCHYAHMDSIPHAEGEPKWVIFKGSLPVHLQLGKLPNIGLGGLLDEHTMDGWEEYVGMLNKRQEDAVGMFASAGRSENGSGEVFRVECGRVCARMRMGK